MSKKNQNLKHSVPSGESSEKIIAEHFLSTLLSYEQYNALSELKTKLEEGSNDTKAHLEAINWALNFIGAREKAFPLALFLFKILNVYFSLDIKEVLQYNNFSKREIKELGDQMSKEHLSLETVLSERDLLIFQSIILDSIIECGLNETAEKYSDNIASQFLKNFENKDLQYIISEKRKIERLIVDLG